MNQEHRSGGQIDVGRIARWLACVLAISLVGLSARPSTAIGQQQNLRTRVAKEGSFVQRLPWHVPNPAESLQELVADSYVIAVGQAVTNRSEFVANDRAIVMVHEVYVIEPMKGTISAGDTVLVVVPGGRVEFPDGSFAETRVNNFTWPAPGKRYVWFLQRVRSSVMADTRDMGRRERLQVYEPAHGPLGIYLLDTDFVQASGMARSRLAATIGLQKLTPGAFTETVRQVIAGSD